VRRARVAPVVLALCAVTLLLSCATVHAAALIPMDLTQTDHLKSYGVAYWALEKGYRVEWLLNYRSGSFLILDGLDDVRSECRYRGVTWEEPDGATLAQIYRQIEEENMELVLLEQAPAIALYAPDNIQPWDDAVMLALEYAEIPYTVIWDAEVQAGGLETYDWLHLHHEDFTGQYGKFHASFRSPASRDSHRLRSTRRPPRARSGSTCGAAGSASRGAPRRTASTSHWPQPGWT